MDYPTKGVAVDASCSGNPGPVEYRGVDLETGDILFEKSYELGTNNLGEFLALVTAMQKYPDKVIYTDSITAIAWARNRTAKTTMKRIEGTEVILRDTFKAEQWLRVNKPKTQVVHWNTREWNEIPADYGKKG